MPAAAALLAGGCVEKVAEQRVRSALVGAGLASATADCMAGRMVDRLSIAQLRKLEALGRDRSDGPGERSLGEYLAAVRRVGNAEAIAVTASSAALCATGLAQ